MKKFLLLVISLSVFPVLAQDFDFESRWTEIDSLESVGLVKSAMEKVETLQKTAIEEGRWNQIVKTYLYHWKFQGLVEEETDLGSLSQLDSLKHTAPQPHKGILSFIKARLTKEFFDDNRSRLGRAHKVVDTSSNDMATWSEVQFIRAYLAELQEVKKAKEPLLSEPADSISPLLLNSISMRHYRPTVYDILMGEFMSDIRNWRTTDPSLYEDWVLPDSIAFGIEGEFSKYPIAGESTEIPNLKKEHLLLMQHIESVHTEDSLPDALVFNQLARLEYFYKKNPQANEHLYEYALGQLVHRYKTDGIEALVKFQLAVFYRSLAERGEQLYPEANRKAAELCMEIMSGQKESEAYQRAKALLSKIERKQIDIKNQRYVPSEMATRVHLTYRNVEALEFHIVRFSMREKLDKLHEFALDSEREWERIKNNNVYAAKLKLPHGADGNLHSTEILVPGLAPGNYLLLFSNEELIASNSYGYSNLKVTDIALLRSETPKDEEFLFVNRSTGKPLANLPVRFSRFMNGESKEIRTNSIGRITHPKYNYYDRHGLELLAVQGKDTLLVEDRIGRRWEDDEEEEEQQGRVVILTDRSIYRPGQTVYFKGIFMIKKGDNTKVVPHQEVLVLIEDPNYDEVLEKHYKTNAYGSFSDSLVLPKKGILGEYTISVEEPDEENRFWEKFWDRGDLSYDEFQFRVEEYKRPRFEILPDPVEEVFRLNDTVMVSGTAKSYMGAAVANAEVKYTIGRVNASGRYYYGYNEGAFVEEGSVKTDANGKYRIYFQDSIAPNEIKERPIYKYRVAIEVTDLNGETREAESSVFVSDRNFKSTLTLPQKIAMGTPLDLEIKSLNFSDNLIPSTGQISVFPKKTASVYKINRLWGKPEFETIPRDHYEGLFPFERYDTSELQERGERVYSLDYESDGVFEKSLSLNLPSGSYDLELIVQGKRGENDTLTRSFEIQDPSVKKLTNGKRFEYTYREADSNSKVASYTLNTSLDTLYVFVNAHVDDKVIYEKMFRLEGKMDVQIPISKAKGQWLNVEFYQVLYNDFESEIHTVNLLEAPSALSVERETFRSKLYPNQQEEWRFIIKNEGQLSRNAEVLATMYDASLDQFVEGEWPRFGFRDYWRREYSRMEEGRMFTTYTGSFFNRKGIYYFRVPSLEQINLFGLDMVHSKYAYNSYLKSSIPAVNGAALSGNTRGVVLDELGVPLPGVNVIVKGTGRGTQTNFDGEFALDTAPGELLVYSYVGYVSVELPASDSPVYINMEADDAVLNEVVVTGYAVKKEKSQARSSVMITVSVGDQVANTIPSTDLESLLSGYAAGVEITQESGAAGTASKVFIRGVSSVPDLERTLFVVDGVPFDFSDGAKSMNLLAEDIVNVSILRGEEALSLYGAEGKKGVVLITTKKTMESFQKVEARKNLKETAFFYPHLRTNHKGEIAFSFIVPEVLTKWKLRLQAHTKKGTHGRALFEAVTTKDFAVAPNLPRFVREGDTLTLKTTLSNLSSDQLQGNALLEFFDGFTQQQLEVTFLSSGKLKPFQLNPGMNGLVEWNIAVPGTVELLGVRIKAVAGAFSDGEEHIIPVLPNRMLVTETTPILVRSKAQTSISLEGFTKNSPTKSNHKVILEVNENPIWDVLKSMPYLLEFPHECAEQTFARFYANKMTENVLEQHPEIANTLTSWAGSDAMEVPLERNDDLKAIVLEETPWVQDSKNESENRRLLSKALEGEQLKMVGEGALAKLQSLQHSDGGFPWFSGGRSNRYISSYILAGFGRLQSMGVEWEGGPDLGSLVNYLDTQVLKDFYEYKKRLLGREQDFFRTSRFLYYLYARSFYLEEYPECPILKAYTPIILEEMEKEWLGLSLFQKAILINVSQNMGWTDLAESILNAVQETVVLSETNGAYWKSNVSGLYWDEAQVEAHALMIEAFYKEGKDLELLKELKLWLLQQKRTHSWSTTKATTAATHALLLGRDSIIPASQQIQYRTGDEKVDAKIASTQEGQSGQTNLRVQWETEEISQSLGKLEISNQGEDPIYGGYYYQFFEDLDRITTDSNGFIQVERAYFIKENQLWKPLTETTPFAVGDKVLVRLTLKTKTDLEFVHVKDQRASGLEPLEVLSGYEQTGGLYYYKTTRDTANHFFIDAMDMGTYVLEYEMVANNAGRFSAGVTTIQCMYAPEYTSHSKGVKMTITD